MEGSERAGKGEDGVGRPTVVTGVRDELRRNGVDLLVIERADGLRSHDFSVEHEAELEGDELRTEQRGVGSERLAIDGDGRQERSE